MNGYSVVKERKQQLLLLFPISSLSRKWGEGILSLHPIAAGNPRFSPLLTKVFLFFLSAGPAACKPPYP